MHDNDGLAGLYTLKYLLPKKKLKNRYWPRNQMYPLGLEILLDRADFNFV